MTTITNEPDFAVLHTGYDDVGHVDHRGVLLRDGYEPDTDDEIDLDDDIGIEEALVLAEVADQEARCASAEAFRALRVRTDLDLDDIAQLAGIADLTSL